MKPLLIPGGRHAGVVRALEATPEQVAASGATLGSYGGVDPIDGDVGFRPAGYQGRQVPPWTQEKARIYSVASYRTNPMARAIIDTYTSFCVGDKGVSAISSSPQVKQVVDEFWTDHRNKLSDRQEEWLRDDLLMGESLTEMLVAKVSGRVRVAPTDPSIIFDVNLLRGNPWWPSEIVFRNPGADQEEQTWSIVDIDDETGLRNGQAMFWTPFKALVTDKRGMPFMSPILDWLDSYDMILSNLIDRTSLSRYLVWDVTVKGGQTDVDAFVKARGGTHVPRSGSVEVHNDSVSWEPKTAPTGAVEDTEAARAVLTLTAAGSGLAKTWLAEPDGANRATSLTMAEPVRRRVGGVQKMWLGYQAETVRYAVDRAVAAGRLPRMVDAVDPATGQQLQIRASQSVTVTGPEIAAADAQITAEVLNNLSVALESLMTSGALSKAAGAAAAKKAWEDFMGVPYRAELDTGDAGVDNIADHVDDSASKNKTPVGGKLRALP